MPALGIIKWIVLVACMLGPIIFGLYLGTFAFAPSNETKKGYYLSLPNVKGRFSIEELSFYLSPCFPRNDGGPSNDVDLQLLLDLASQRPTTTQEQQLEDYNDPVTMIRNRIACLNQANKMYKKVKY